MILMGVNSEGSSGRCQKKLAAGAESARAVVHIFAEILAVMLAATCRSSMDLGTIGG